MNYIEDLKPEFARAPEEHETWWEKIQDYVTAKDSICLDV
jgi:hypothetical protein